MKHTFKKQFGQNFLRNNKYAEKLIKAADITENDLVIEIGPGDGRVTALLLERAQKVLAIDIDYDVIVMMVKKFGDNTDFELIHKDIMEVTEAEIDEIFAGKSYKVIGSLPYNISKQIIRKFINHKNLPKQMAFIIQEEVAQAYATEPPKATFLGNWLQLRAEVSKGVSIPKKQFFPVPNVNGGILSITPKHFSEAELTEVKEISKLMKLGFTTPRKTLWNNLKSSGKYSEEKLEGAFSELDLEKQRPAELELAEWQRLNELLQE